MLPLTPKTLIQKSVAIPKSLHGQLLPGQTLRLEKIFHVHKLWYDCGTELVRHPAILDKLNASLKKLRLDLFTSDTPVVLKGAFDIHRNEIDELLCKDLFENVGGCSIGIKLDTYPRVLEKIMNRSNLILKPNRLRIGIGEETCLVLVYLSLHKLLRLASVPITGGTKVSHDARVHKRQLPTCCTLWLFAYSVSMNRTNAECRKVAGLLLEYLQLILDELENFESKVFPFADAFSKKVDQGFVHAIHSNSAEVIKGNNPNRTGQWTSTILPTNSAVQLAKVKSQPTTHGSKIFGIEITVDEVCKVWNAIFGSHFPDGLPARRVPVNPIRDVVGRDRKREDVAISVALHHNFGESLVEHIHLFLEVLVNPLGSQFAANNGTLVTKSCWAYQIKRQVGEGSLEAASSWDIQCKEVDNLIQGSVEVLSRPTLDFILDAAKSLKKNILDAPSGAVRAEKSKIVDVKAVFRVELSNLWSIDLFEPILGDDLVRDVLH
ncbi:hypothetical protein HG531_009188 [Fusarium graminearum]|nr:hypothetical protein HG531_009188 [Fusarium graminearum]